MLLRNAPSLLQDCQDKAFGWHSLLTEAGLSLNSRFQVQILGLITKMFKLYELHPFMIHMSHLSLFLPVWQCSVSHLLAPSFKLSGRSCQVQDTTAKMERLVRS